MSFREKSAWITLTTILFVTAVYATHGVFEYEADEGEQR